MARFATRTGILSNRAWRLSESSKGKIRSPCILAHITRSEPISFSWKGTIEGRGGVLEFTFDGRAKKAFLRNRIGICVLHPIIECAGKPCRVRHSDGAWKEQSFPRFISPHQPFKDIRALSWSPSDRVQANIELEGEVFEMEDQRNWTDASFKTYSTPLELPFPVQVSVLANRSVSASFSASSSNTGAISAPEEVTGQDHHLSWFDDETSPKDRLVRGLEGMFPTLRSIESVWRVFA